MGNETINEAGRAGGNSSCSIGVDLNHPLCAVCQRGWMKDGLSHCKLCVTTNIMRKWTMVVFFAFVMLALFYACSKMFKDRLHKMRMLVLDVIRLGTIVVTFVQIGTSLPNVIQIDWPQNFLEWLDFLSVVNFDIVDLTGIGCGIRINHGHKLLFMGSLPLIFLGLATLSFGRASQKLNNRLTRLYQFSAEDHELDEDDELEKLWDQSISHAFDLIDADNSETLDLEELTQMLTVIYGKVVQHDGKNRPMRRVSSWKRVHKIGQTERAKILLTEWNGHANGDASRPMVLQWMHKHRCDSNKGQQIRLIKFAAISSMASLRFGVAVQLMFLTHSPISQMAFQFLDCRPVGDPFNNITLPHVERFLHKDYSLKCSSSEWKYWSIFVYLILLLFSFGLPAMALSVLYVRRKELYTTKVKSQIGWLYNRYTYGAEWWDIEELVRKLLLCGVLVVLPDPRIQLPVAIAICLWSIIMLTTFQPHRSRIVFNVCQLAFLATTMKFVAGLQLQSKESQDRSYQAQVGIFMMLVDCGVFIAATIAVFLMAYYVVVKGVELNVEHKTNSKKINSQKIRMVQKERQTAIVPNVWRHKKFRKSVMAAVVNQSVVEKLAEHRETRAKLIIDVKHKQQLARSRVSQRLMSRKHSSVLKMLKKQETTTASKKKSEKIQVEEENVVNTQVEEIRLVAQQKKLEHVHKKKEHKKKEHDGTTTTTASKKKSEKIQVKEENVVDPKVEKIPLPLVAQPKEVANVQKKKEHNGTTTTAASKKKSEKIRVKEEKVVDPKVDKIRLVLMAVIKSPEKLSELFKKLNKRQDGNADVISRTKFQKLTVGAIASKVRMQKIDDLLLAKVWQSVTGGRGGKTIRREEVEIWFQWSVRDPDADAANAKKL